MRTRLPAKRPRSFVQVDERVAPAGDPDRNLTHLQESLLGQSSLPPEQIHVMLVEAPDLDAAAAHVNPLRRTLLPNQAGTDKLNYLIVTVFAFNVSAQTLLLRSLAAFRAA
jgi:hypothetical protein